MAVIIKDVDYEDDEKVRGTVVADTKQEVISGMTFANKELMFGSTALTVDGDVALLDSEGTWHWIGEEA